MAHLTATLYKSKTILLCWYVKCSRFKISE